MGKGKKKAGVTPGADAELVEQYLKLMELQHSVVTTAWTQMDRTNPRDMIPKIPGVIPGKKMLDEYRKNQEAADEAERRTAKLMAQLSKDLARGVKPPVTYEDSDQTPLGGMEGKILKHMWAGGMDYSPFAEGTHLSEWCVTLFKGDYRRMLQLLEGKQGDELTQMLERRESLMNMSSIFHVIQGARTLTCPSDMFTHIQQKYRTLKSDHMACLKKLLDLGVKINTHDFAGYTPLFHCLTMYSTPLTLQLAELLMQKGANPNEPNRFGCTPLHENVPHNKLEVIKLLIKYKANPMIEDLDGISPHKMNLSPEIAMLFAKAGSKQCKELRKEAKQSKGFKECEVCNTANCTKRCSGCYLVWYCGAECQSADWSSHKQTCKQTRKEYLPVNLNSDRKDFTSLVFNYNTGTGLVRSLQDTSSTAKGKFSVKVQVPLRGMQGALLVYNKDRDILGYISSEQDHLYNTLVANVLEKGVNRNKAFFPAVYSSGDGLKINPNIVLPPETW